MAPTIRIDDEVYAWLQGQARPFDDTPNSVLRRLAQMNTPTVTATATVVRPGNSMGRGPRTPQNAYRNPILKVLEKHGGQAARMSVLNEVEKMLAKQLTPHDKADISSGGVRWQKSAEWEVRAMREAGLLKPVSEAPPGYWSLTKTGEAAAQNA